MTKDKMREVVSTYIRGLHTDNLEKLFYLIIDALPEEPVHHDKYCYECGTTPCRFEKPCETKPEPKECAHEWVTLGDYKTLKCQFCGIEKPKFAAEPPKAEKVEWEKFLEDKWNGCVRTTNGYIFIDPDEYKSFIRSEVIDKICEEIATETWSHGRTPVRECVDAVRNKWSMK